MSPRHHTILLASLAALAAAAPAASAADASTLGHAARVHGRTITVKPAARSSRKLTFKVSKSKIRTVTSARLRLGKRTKKLSAKSLRVRTSRTGRLVLPVRTTASERRRAKLDLTIAKTVGGTATTVTTTVTTTTTTVAGKAPASGSAPGTGTGTGSVPASPTAGTAPSSGAPAPGPGGATSIGMHSSLRWLEGQALEDAVIRMADVGVTVAREDLSWNRIEAQQGTYDWTSFDRVVAAGARHGVRILAIPDDAPNWATGAWNMAPVSGAGLSGYTEFVRAAIKRYGTLGSFWAANPSLPKTPIVEWDIWNEPMWKYAWANSSLPDPAVYGAMFRDVVSAVENEDPGAKFLLEADTAIPQDSWPQKPWLSAALDVPGVREHVDGISLHDYTKNAADCTPYSPSKGMASDYLATQKQFCRVLDARRILNAYGLAKAELWMTETGATTGKGTRGVSEAQQAQIVHDVFAKLREWHVVSGVIWYQMSDAPNPDPNDDEDWFGLFRSDGSAKPAWSAFVSEVAAGLPSPS